MTARHTNIRALALALACVLASAAFAQGPRSLLKELQLRKGQEYSAARARLASAGWKPDFRYVTNADQEDQKPYGFDDVVCGSGRQAVCSARFLRGGREILLTLQPKEKLVLEGAWDDKQ